MIGSKIFYAPVQSALERSVAGTHLQRSKFLSHKYYHYVLYIHHPLAQGVFW